ncbi:MAG: sugar kinase [Actinobacteria bacterium]|nr:sugar kinase [Actinomycetota bacterium]MBU1944517.1 sugar kinase [Actinomycetota bacterium]MBU2689070.1 sugar kinase [Actinomycetota bacterium]
MGVLVVGSVALDSVQTPFGTVREALGGAATFFSVAAAYFTDVDIVAVVGTDFPAEHIEFLRSRGIGTGGLTVEDGETFRWAGVYGYDLNDRDTIDTRLGVFESFRPSIPSSLAESEFVFLANIDPGLQLSVLDQVERPRLVACDTMNFWIERNRPELVELLSRVDIMVMNDAECRMLAEEPNLIKAARIVLGMGPDAVIVKKGEHGALMCTEEGFFSAPAYPCESVFDPTGAGDSFAGGFMGHLAGTGDVSPENIRRAIIYGTVMASFCVEDFSVDGMASLDRIDIDRRFLVLRQVALFEP